MTVRIVVLAKLPVPGRVKTRLAVTLGDRTAAEIASEFLRTTLNEALATGLPVELCGDPDPTEGGWSDYVEPGLSLAGQGPGDLGERLDRATRRAVQSDHHPLLIGTDCPSLDRARLSAAAARLADHDAVIHPAEDGGFVLLGLRRHHPEIFTGVDWGTGRVFAQTMAGLARAGFAVDVLETLRDIDRPEDLL